MAVRKVLVVLCVVPLLFAQESTNNYGESGADWTGTCASGIAQSPIDIDEDTVQQWPSYEFFKVTTQFTNFSGEAAKPLLNGSEYVVTRTDGASFGSMTAYRIGASASTTYSCSRFVFHAPSEHTIDGESFDLEMQVECSVATSSGVARNEAILSILFEEDDDESEFLTALQGVTTAAVTWESLYEYAAVEHYYTYEGSRTTPDCRETVTWIVDSNVRDATTAQINFYAQNWAQAPTFANGKGNNRSTQVLNNRPVYVVGDEYDEDFGLAMIAGLAGALLF